MTESGPIIPTPDTDGAPLAEIALDDNGIADDVPNSAVPAQLPRSPWGFVDVLAGLGVLLIVNTATQAVVAFSGLRPDRTILVLLSMTGVWVALLSTSWWASRRHGSGNLVRDYGLSFRWQDLWTGGLTGISLRVAAMLIAGTAVALTHYRGNGGGTSNIPLTATGNTVMVIVIGIATILIAPIIEEIFFRGLLLRSALSSLERRSYQPRFAKPVVRTRVAALLSAAFFAGVHITEAADTFTAAILLVSLFLVGWVNARLTLWSQRLGPAIISHSVFNATAFAVLMFVQR